MAVDKDHEIRFGTLTADGLIDVRKIKQSDIAKCPFFILDQRHYNQDGSCKCRDPKEQVRMMREWGYQPSDFEKHGIQVSNDLNPRRPIRKLLVRIEALKRKLWQRQDDWDELAKKHGAKVVREWGPDDPIIVRLNISPEEVRKHREYLEREKKRPKKK